MHKKRKQKKKGGFGRALLILLCLFLILVIGAAGFLSSKLGLLDRDGYTEAVDEEGNIVSVGDGSGRTGGIVGVIRGALGVGEKDVVNVLLIGSDMRIPHTDDIGRGDVTMLCSLNKKTGAVKLASFERGTGVPWEGHEWLMLTSFYRFNGAGSWTNSMKTGDYVKKQNDYARAMRAMYEGFDRVTDGRYHREAVSASHRLYFLTRVNLRDFDGIFDPHYRRYYEELPGRERMLIRFEQRCPKAYASLQKLSHRIRGGKA